MRAARLKQGSVLENLQPEDLVSLGDYGWCDNCQPPQLATVAETNIIMFEGDVIFGLAPPSPYPYHEFTLSCACGTMVDAVVSRFQEVRCVRPG